MGQEISEARREQLREAGRAGGRATLARHGRDHFSAIGKLGFAATMETHGGEVLAYLLGASYQAKYGRPINLTTGRNLAAERERAATRRAYPDPQPCALCPEMGEERHHPDGWQAGHARITWLCRPCHDEVHEQLRLDAREERRIEALKRRARGGR